MSEQPASRFQALLQTLGPGLLFAGTAVGVSHLVQSTRAGAGFGFALVLIVLAANIFKYPAFSFGARYASATGTSLLQGYRRQGTWALVLYGLVTLATMFTVQAAVTFVTVALALNLLGDPGFGAWNHTIAAGALTLTCAGLLAVGRYRWMQRVINVSVVIFTLATLIATLLALPKIELAQASVIPPASSLSDPIMMLTLVALIGWMPSAFDISIWQSLWTTARARDNQQRGSVRDVMRDFKLGYWGTTVLALCFLTLGAVVMFQSQVKFVDNPVGFAAQLIALFSESFGAWSKPVIALAAFTVMFSTTLTVIDGFPRALATLRDRFAADEQPDQSGEACRKVYWGAIGVLALGSLLIIRSFLSSLTSMVDLATTLSVTTAPVLAWLNHRAVFADPEMGEGKPGLRMMWYSYAGIAFSLALVGYFAWAKLA